MLAAYNFDETSGVTVLDYSGNARNAHSEVVRTAGKNGPGASGPRTVLMGDASSVLGAQYNSGVASYLTSVKAMSCWVYQSGSPWPDGVMVGFMSINNETAFGFFVTSGTFASRFRNTSNTSYGGSVATGVSGASWHHAAMSWNSSTGLVTMWWDGVNVGTYSVVGTPRITANDIFICDPSALGARVDDLRVYDTVLTTAQVQSDMVTPVGGSAPVDVRNIRIGSAVPAAQYVGANIIKARLGSDLIWS